ncbi:TenA family protein [Actinomycetaceae bacterium UMB8039B]|nr:MULTISPECIES: TenA family protein [Actinomycetaceae]MDK7780311.1 TenA family protein [Actinomycetaceae bacterium UMB8041B]MDK8293211.1 TenA family protein [Actinomycetaceae bacterium UMB8039B]MDK8608657.1 TenA family protein [Actinomycetaceae bacterium UMB8041A]MDK8752588.1 TenA family protein [Actinomycetaceae bacterium UMB8039A]MDK6830903.1 TenA family protein [Pauljensenia sp. UMB8040A]
MMFTDELWEEIAPIKKAIDQGQFVRGLGDGSLSQDKFNYYMVQDALYLAAYAKALAGLATFAHDPDDLVFWAEASANSIKVERELHASHVDVMAAATPSPTCRAYSDFLAAQLASGEYGIAAAAVLPCFWIYQVVGTELLDTAGDLEKHPYGDWIGMYANPVFAEETKIVRGIVDRVAEGVVELQRQRMRDAFVQASRYEWMFWDAAWRMETWPI